MATPRFSTSPFFGGSLLLARPEELVILDANFTHDRIRRIQYGDISMVCLGRTFALLWSVFLLVFLLATVGLYLNQNYGNSALVLLPVDGVLAWLAVRGRTVLIIDVRGRTLRFPSNYASRSRPAAFVGAVLGYVERDQGASPEWLTAAGLQMREERARAEALRQSADVPLRQDEGDVQDDLLVGETGGLGQ